MNKRKRTAITYIERSVQTYVTPFSVGSLHYVRDTQYNIVYRNSMAFVRF